MLPMQTINTESWQRGSKRGSKRNHCLILLAAPVIGLALLRSPKPATSRQVGSGAVPHTTYPRRDQPTGSAVALSSFGHLAHKADDIRIVSAARAKSLFAQRRELVANPSGFLELQIPGMVEHLLFQ